MAININPNRLAVPPAQTGQTTPSPIQAELERRRQQQQARAKEQSEVIPTRAQTNIIPPPESIETMVNSAVSASRRGVYWDRGTIVDLLV